MSAESATLSSTTYETITPALALGLPFKPARFKAAYTTWPLLTELFPVSFPGVKTSRDDFLVDVDRDALAQRMSQYFDVSISHDEMRRLAPSIMQSTARYDAEATRTKLQKRGLLPQNIVRYGYRPFDTRWVYWEREGKLLDEKRPDYFPQVFEGNVWIAAAQNQRKDFDTPISFVSSLLTSCDRTWCEYAFRCICNKKPPCLSLRRASPTSATC